MLHGVQQDLVLAARGLAARPRLSAVAIASLALGIGANASVYSLIDAVLFRPFDAVRAPEELLVLRTSGSDGEWENPSTPDGDAYRRESRSFSDLAAHAPMTFSVRARGASARVWGEMVSWNYLRTLGASPVTGRDFTADEETSPRPVVVISERLARRSFPADADVLGSTLTVNGEALTVVGVAPEGFRGISVGRDMDLWVPLGMAETLSPSFAEFLPRRDVAGMAMVGRLAAGSSPSVATVELQALSDRLASAAPDAEPTERRMRVATLADARLQSQNGAFSYFFILAGVVGLVLVIAATNVSMLRGIELSSRSHELAMRAALGASRGRIARLLLIDNVVLYVFALTASVVVARGVNRLLATLPLFPVPLPDLSLRIDGRVLMIAAGLALAASVLTSLGPMLRTREARPSGGGRTARDTGGRRSLVAVQIALSCALLSGTGLLSGVLVRAYSIDPGYRLRDVLFVSVDLQSMGFRYDEERTERFYREVLERVEVLPNVRRAAWSADIPFERMTIRTLFVPDVEPDFNLGVDEPDWLDAHADIVTAGYLETMGIPLLRGRAFTTRDDQEAPGVVLVNETMASRYWPGEDAVGRHIRVWGRRGIHHETYEIIGIVKDVRYHSVFEAPGPYIYYPVAQRFFQVMNLHVHVAGSIDAVVPPVRDAISAVDADVPVFDARPLSEERSIALARQRTAATLLGMSGALALVLTALGTYSVVAEGVRRRTAEIGLRSAVGASARDIRRLVVRHTAPTILVGVVFGLAASIVLGELSASLLVGASGLPVATYGGSMALLAVISFLACLVPARRAARIDPATALRYDG